MKIKRSSKIFFISAALILCLSAVFATVAFADGTGKTDAMENIEAAFTEYKVGDTVSVADEGYIGIPVEITTYYDSATHGAAKKGYNGTPLVIYVVNTGVERIGAKSDVDIITSMLGRGYIVAVLDYLNSDKAVSPALDWSTQTIRKTIMTSSYFKDTSKIPSGTYYSNYIVPAGYDVCIRNVFWESDKHGADGTLDKIVENWNTDFRGWFRDTVIYWLNSDGEQKETQNGFDGSAPQWYSDANGANPVDATSADAKYIKAQHTLATDITDCTGKDGTPIDLNLYMDIVYPTTSSGEGAISPVPIIVLANSSEYLSTASTGSGLRPQHNGFLFNGYAGASFDYLYQPMAQSDYYGYYDGRTEHGALTGDRMNYGLHLYNDKRINTAAMRYLRYLTLTSPEVYSFDTESIGVFGNSKGGWFTFLGEAELRNPTTVASGMTLAESIDARINSYTSKRMFTENSYKTRYDMERATYVKNGVTIDGGELQPWLTYTDKSGNVCEIPSYASWIYASNGSQNEDITEGHAPTFIALHLQDDFSTYSNAFGELTGCLNDIPSFYVVVDLGHTFAYGPDWYYGYDTYQAMFDFANYYLQNDSVKVVYISPSDKTGLIGADAPITVKFSGAVPAEEIAKVILKDSDGEAVPGSWSYKRGMTEWTFEHDALEGNSTYSLIIPADLAGDNGKAIGCETVAKYTTEPETSYSVDTVSTNAGSYFIVNAPDMASASDARIRFRVANNAANIASLYEVSGFYSANPDDCTVGALVGSVNLKGAGYYEIDVSDKVGEAQGEQLVFLLKADKNATETQKLLDLSSSISSVSLGAYARKNDDTKAPDGSAASGLYINENIGTNGNPQYPHEVFYANTTTLISAANLFGTSNITDADLGRRYTVTLRVYDTVSRVIQFTMNSVATATNGVHDFDKVHYNFMTKAGEWNDLTFEYVVYEPEYGNCSRTKKTLTVSLATTGESEMPIYVDYLKVTEKVTGIELDDKDAASLILGEREDGYKVSESDKPFSIGNTYYATLGAALTAAKSGNEVVMHSNYTLTAQDNFSAWCALENISINLNGYKLYAANGASPIVAKVTSKTVAKTSITITDGSIYLYDSPLISYTGSTAAGTGKAYDITLDGVNILNARGSKLSYLISSPTIESASGAEVVINLIDSNIDFRKNLNVNNPTSIFPKGVETLDLSYTVCGGDIYIDTLAAATVWETCKKVELIPDAQGNYTTLSVPESLNVSSVSAMRNDGIASYSSPVCEGGVATYVCEKSEFSTKYGLIPEEYSDAQSYPFVFFDENGNFKGAYNCFIGNGDNGAGGVLGAAKNYVVNSWDGISYGPSPKEAFIIMRRDYTFDSTKDVKFVNFAQLQGTVNIDLGGYTLSAGTVAHPIFPAYSKGYSGSASGNPIFPSTVNVCNGTLRNYKSGIVAMSTWDSAGGGTIANKNFNFNFDNVTIAFVDGADCAGLTAHGRDATNTPGAAAPFNFTYNDCTFDLVSGKAQFNPVIFSLSTIAGRYIKLTVEVNGGTVIADDPSIVTIVGTTTSDTYGSSVTFNKGSDGEYLTYRVPTGSSVKIGNYQNKDGEILGFAKSATEGDEDVYILAANPLASDYGVITDTYADESAYPFAVFVSNSGFYQGYSTLKAAISAAKTQTYKHNVWDSENKTYGDDEIYSVILLRRNYTTTTSDSYADFAQVQGKLILDLDGNTITQGSGTSGIFYTVTTKGWSGSGEGYVFLTNYIVKNGTLLVGSGPVVYANMWNSVYGKDYSMADKDFIWDFENVNFGFASGATTSNMLVGYKSPNSASSNPPDAAAPMYFNYNNCTFDLETNAPSAGAKLFNASPSDGYWIKATVTVTGGEIKAPSLTLANLYSTESVYGSTVSFVTDEDGNRTKLYIASGGSAPSGDVSVGSGNMQFVKTETATDYTLYTLSELDTKYGTIPSTYASVEDYPFVVFKYQNGEYAFVAGCSKFYGSQAGTSAIGKSVYSVLRDNNTYNPETGKYNDDCATAIILMRRDYDLKSGTASSFEYHNNIAQAQGTIIIDLDGHTLMQNSASTRALFYVTTKGWSGSDDGNYVFPTTISVRNGELQVYNSAALVANMNNGIYSYGASVSDKDFTFEFDNVKFSLAKGATTSYLVNSFDKADSHNSQVAPFEIIVKDCTFDLESVVPATKVTLFNNNATGYYMDCDITVIGGKILAPSLTNVAYYQNDGANGSTTVFAKNSEGKHLKLETLATTAYPAETFIFTTEGGKKATWLLRESDSSCAVYELAESITLKYGDIPARYESAEDYPFVVFRGGAFVFATDKFGIDATDSALHKAKTNGSIILMRRDYTNTQKRYANLSQANGAITIDLGGYTFTVSSSASEFLYAQKKTNYDTTVTVINGSILTCGSPIIRYSSWAGSSGSYPGGKYFNINFEDVTFGVCEGYNPVAFIAEASENLAEPLTYGTLTLTDCTIDIRGVDSTTLFDVNDASNIIIVTVQVVGGKIIGNDLSDITWSLTAADSSVTWKRGEDGNYTMLYTTAKTVSQASFVTEEGELSFVKTGDADGYGIYKLAEKSLSDFTPKVSISLYADFVYNIYLPIRDDILSVTLAGESVDISTLDIEEIDGAWYYHLTKAMAASSAAEIFELLVSIELSDGNAANGKWTMSIVKYANTVLSSEDSTETECALMKDMLAYIKEAYLYFKPDESQAACEAIDSVIGDYYEEEVTFDESELEVKTKFEGLDSATFDLCAVPAFIFYPQTDDNGEMLYAPQAYVFTQNGNVLTPEILEDENGKTYIKVEVFAYGIGLDIEYSISGTEISGAYNVKTYYEFTKTLENDALTALVARLWKYSERAEQYRESVN